MRTTVCFLLLSVTLFASAAAPAQAPDSLQQDEALENIRHDKVKQDKIKQQVMQAKPGSVLAFNGDGSVADSIVVPARRLYEAGSLRAFLKQYSDESSRDEAESRSAIRKPDPIAECEEPKTVPPPPECVVCKNGQTICARPSSAKLVDVPQ
jgi:hypothetical protein